MQTSCIRCSDLALEHSPGRQPPCQKFDDCEVYDDDDGNNKKVGTSGLRLYHLHHHHRHHPHHHQGNLRFEDLLQEFRRFSSESLHCVDQVSYCLLSLIHLFKVVLRFLNFLHLIHL